MKQKHMNLLKTALIAVSFIVYPLSYAQDEIGVAAAVNTKTIDMVAYPGGNIENRNVDPGYKIISNRTIQTNKSGKAQMLLVDGTAFTIGPNSTVTLDKFIYDPATASGSLEVSAKGLVRLVGGKVTKKRPAIIKTSTATVGIRGGIAIVEASSEETKASFVYGVEMEVAPIENPDNSLVLTQVGLSVEVEAGSDEVEDPEVLTSEELDSYSDEFEGDEEPENEESDEESTSEESSEDSESDNEESDESESEESEESEGDESESEETEESEESEESESEETEESKSEESESEESDETGTEESEESENEESDNDELEDSKETDESNDGEESNETDNEESDQRDSEEAENSENSNDDSTEEENSLEQDSEESNDVESSESGTETQSSETNEELDQDSEDEQSPQVNESTDNEETPPETSSQDDEIVETGSSEEDSSLGESSDESNNQVTGQNTNSDSLETSDDASQDESSSSAATNSTTSANDENPLTNSSSNDASVNNSSGQDNNENSDSPLVVTSSSSSDDSTPVIQTDNEKTIEDKPVVQPPTSTSSSDSVTLTQPPISTSPSDSVPLTQPPVSTSSSDLITLEPANEEPEPLVPEIDESLLDNFDISKNTSDTGIEDLSTAYDQGGELFIDDTQIETQEEEFIEEATEANEEVQVEEVQQEAKVEAVVEAQLSTNTSFLQNNITEDTSVGASLGKIEVEYTGADVVRFAMGGPGSENFEIDQSGNIILKGELDYEEKQTYNLLVFTFLGDKSISNKLDLNVIDIDEEPVVNLNILSSSLREDSQTETEFAKIEVFDPEKNGISMTVSGEDKDKVEVSNSGNIILSKSLDYEQKKELNFVVDVFDGKNIVSKPISIKIDNVHDLTASVNLSGSSLHEGSSINSVIGNINVSGDPNLSYSLEGDQNEDFIVSSDGKIKVRNSLDFEIRDSYQLTLHVNGQNDSVSIPLNINLAKNIDPDFKTICNNSCEFQENTKIGTVVISSLRIDEDTDSLSYSLENNYQDKFSIDDKSGEVKINNSLDYESASSYNLKVIASDSKGSTKEISSTFTVTDVEIPYRSFDTKNSNFVGNKELFAEPSDDQGRFYLPDDMSSKDKSERVLFDLNQGNLPDGSQYVVSAEDVAKYEVDSSGIVRIKSDVILNNDVSKKLSGQNLINYLAGSEDAISDSDHESFTDTANFTIDIPNEPNQQVELKIVPKKVESQENVVMKFASGYNNVNHNISNAFKASASRGDGTAKNYNSSVESFGQTITESTLSTLQLEENSKLESIIKMDDGSKAYYASSNSEKTFYRTNTVANGLNENDTNTLDFEYWFPVNNISNIGTNNTKGQYAPLAVKNADWDNQTSLNERAKYGCYDSGQGCGSGKNELVLSGSMVQSTEDFGDPSFEGYKVIQSKMTIETNTLRNSNMDGTNAGNGSSSGIGSYNNIIAQGAALSGGLQGFNLGQDNDEFYSEFETVALPESFNYFGQDFTHIYVNENGFLTFGNGGADSDKPWSDKIFDADDYSSNQTRPHLGGGRALQYLDDAGSYGDSVVYYPSFHRYPDVYGKPGSSFQGNLNNSIFALWADYNNDSADSLCDDDGCNDFSIRKLWDADSKILTIGWYNMKSHGFNDDDGEANFEVQLNFENNEFKIVHGDFGDNFSKSDNNSVFVGFSKDVTCSSLGEDISGCEGKDYVQLFWHNQGYGSFESVDDDFNSTFQNPLMDKPYFNNSLYNSYFHDNQTKNGTEYCFDSGTAANTFSASANCGINYTWNDAKGIETHKHLTRAVPRYIGGGGIKNILLPSNIKQSFAVGTEAEFVWMHLNKPSTILSYTPAEDNASGFEQVGANSNATVTGGVIKSGDSVTTTTFADEIVIGGEVYKDSKLKSFLNNTKKVVAFAPIPVLHTNKYEMSQSPDTTDIRFKHAHTIMPQFISEEFMEDKNNGTDLRFDFHQLVDHDYSKSGSHLKYGTEGDSNFALQNQFAASHSEADIDGMYAFAADALDKNISSKRFSGATSGEEYTIPEGQSLWQQILNPEGRGSGIFVQMNWSCGSGGLARCNEDTSSRIYGPHKTQQSLFSVLISEVGDKVFFEESPDGTGQDRYTALNSGQVMQGEHFWSYKRRSGRTISSDGEFAISDDSPQLTFGVSPIACVSGKDNGCFFGDGQTYDSGIVGAPSAAIISTDDPCHSGLISGCSNDMDLAVMHSMAQTTDANNPEYRVGTFYQGIVQQKQRDTNNNLVDAINLAGNNSWRSDHITTSNSWSGMMTGLFITDTNNNLNPHPQYLRANTTTTFDDVNDKVMVEQTSLNIYSIQSNQTNSNDWYHSSGYYSGRNANLASITDKPGFKFGGANSSAVQPYYGNDQWSPSAYLNKEVFGAMLEGQNVGKADKAFLSNGNISSTSDGDNAGAIVTWNTIDEKDRDFMSDDSLEPSLEYMTWGVWGMAMSDSQLNMPGYQASAVHMGTWFAGDLLDVSDWPISRTASLAGMAMFDVFARIEESGITNSYHWTEGAGATGSVVFDGTGNYDIDITVANLGTENCPSSYCGSGFQPGSMNKGSLGSITWSANGGVGQPKFESTLIENINGNSLISKQMWGELYGKRNHLEAGAILQYSQQSNKEMIMYSGTAILSE